MKTYTLSFKPGFSTMTDLTRYRDCFNGPTQQGDRYALTGILGFDLEKLVMVLIESGARKIEISGIHMLRVVGFRDMYPGIENHIKQTVARLFLATGVNVTPILNEPHGFLLDARSEANARQILRELKVIGYDLEYIAAPIGSGNAKPQQIRFQVIPEHKIDAIRLIHMWTEEGLKRSKEFVEAGSITIPGDLARVQAFEEALEPFVYGLEKVTPLETFKLPTNILDQNALADHLEALAKIIRNMHLPTPMA